MTDLKEEMLIAINNNIKFYPTLDTLEAAKAAAEVTKRYIEKAFDAGGSAWAEWLRTQNPDPSVVEANHPVRAKIKWLRENGVTEH